MRRQLWIGAGALAVMVVGACAPGATPRAGVALRVAALDDDVGFGAAPFPSDVFLDERGRVGPIPRLEDAIPLEHEAVLAQLAKMDGTGLRPTVLFFLADPDASEDVDVAALARALVVVDVTAGSAHAGTRVPMGWRLSDDGRALTGAPEPGVVLREGARYAALALAPTFAIDERTTRLLTAREADVPARWRSTVRAIPELRRVAETRGGADIAALTVFTVAHVKGPVVAARTLLEEQAPPALEFPDEGVCFVGDALDRVFGVPAREDAGAHAGEERWGWANPSGIAHAHVGAVLTGVMRTPSFLEGDVMAEDDDGAPRITGLAPVPITFVLPAAPPPPGGYPVAIVGHGLGAGRHQVLAFAEPLCAQGFALVAIDMHGHGSRFVDVDERNNAAMIVAAFDGDADAPDGFGDVTGTGSVFHLMHDMRDLHATRDSVRQSALDLASVARLLSAGVDLTAVRGAPALLDGTRVAYVGESYGAVVGTVFAAIEPLVELFILDVPGGGVLDLAISGSPDMQPMIDLFVRSVYGVDGKLDRFHPLISLAQGLLDGADPLSFAPHILRDRFTVAGRVLPPRHVIGLEVLGDEVIPNQSTDAWARALGLARLLPRLTTMDAPVVDAPAAANVEGQTAVLVEYAPATHGANWVSDRGVRKFAPYLADDDAFVRLDASVEIENPMRATMAQVTHALATWRATGTPEVISTAPPRPDFDDDGLLDDDDPAPLSR